MPPRPALHSIQALRGLAAMLVLLFHLRIVEARYGTGADLLPGWSRFADAGVDLFFVISGFVMAIVAAGQFGSGANAGRFLARRAWRIVPPYWFYTSVVVALMWAMPGMGNRSYEGQSIIASYLFWPHEQLPVLTVGWTLNHEVYFYLVMAMAIAVLRERHFPAFLLAWACVVLVAQPLLRGGTLPPLALALNAMTLEFIAGAAIGHCWQKLPRAWAWPSLLAGTLAFIAGMLWFDGADAGVLQPLQRVLVFGTSSALIVIGAATLERTGKLQVPRWAVRLGDSSYSLYLSHVFVVSAAGRLWQMTALNTSIVQHFAFIVVTTVACVVVGVLSHQFLERPLLRMAPTWPRAHAFRPGKPA